MIYLNGTTRILGTVNIGSGSLWSPPVEPPTPSTLLDGLSSYFKMDETVGTEFYDSTGSVTGSINAGTLGNTGIIDTCYHNSSSVEDLLGFGDNFNFLYGEPISLNYWIYYDDLTGTCPFSKIGAGSDGETRAYLSSNRLGLFIYKVNTKINLSDGPLMTTGEWQMVTWTYDGSGNASGFKAYRNGVYDAFTIVTNNLGTTDLSSNTGTFWLGSRDLVNDPHQGKLDEFGVWSKVLSQSEIDELYASGSGNTYPFS